MQVSETLQHLRVHLLEILVRRICLPQFPALLKFKVLKDLTQQEVVEEEALMEKAQIG